MKKQQEIHIYLISSLLALTLFTEQSKAEKIIVKKVKGKQAIVETTNAPLEVGQTYELANDPISDDVSYKSEVLKSRKNSLTFGTRFDYLKSDTLQSNNLNLQIRYGWNFSNLEVGALLEASSSDSGAGATTTFLGGGYFDYNLVANRSPKNLIYGPFVLLAFGSTSFPSGTGGGSTSQLSSNVGGFLTYFIGDTSVAFRGELYGSYQQVNTSTAQNSLVGGGFRGLLALYF